LREVALDGDLTGEQRKRLIEIAERCPVHAPLTRGARIGTNDVDELSGLAGVEQAGQHAHDMVLD
jgi:hypothetical protein